MGFDIDSRTFTEFDHLPSSNISKFDQRFLAVEKRLEYLETLRHVPGEKRRPSPPKLNLHVNGIIDNKMTDDDKIIAEDIPSKNIHMQSKSNSKRSRKRRKNNKNTNTTVRTPNNVLHNASPPSPMNALSQALFSSTDFSLKSTENKGRKEFNKDDVNFNEEDKNKKLSFLDYVMPDLVWKEEDDYSRNEGASSDNTVQNVLLVPFRVEQFVSHGVLVCLDAFLFTLTFLPMRIVWACFILLQSLFFPPRMRVFGMVRRTHVYDLLRGIMIIGGIYILCYIRMSFIYHYIRGQAFIKLYVIFNMLEIIDKLFTAIGQDIIGSLYYNVRYQPRNYIKVLGLSLLATAYVSLHAFSKYLQLVTFTVAINSSNKSLVTLLISNNFVEVKSTVFKRFDGSSLFQISCSDVCERFILVIFLILSGLQFTDSFEDFLTTAGSVFFSEMIIDYIKHAFVSKFNGHNVKEFYACYSAILSKDVTSHRYENTTMDPTHYVVNRLGIGILPLTCVVVRTIGKQWMESELFHPFTLPGMCFVILIFIILVLLKIIVNVVLHAIAAIHEHHWDTETLYEVAAKKVRQDYRTPGEKLRALDKIKRFTMWGKKIPM